VSVPWTFGEEPLPQTVNAAVRLRRVISLIQALEEPEPEVERLIAELERVSAVLGGHVPVDERPRIGAAASGSGRVYLDHARDVGTYNPCFPDYDLVVDGERASGTVTFPIAYEGPPGVVHGGFLALLFDCAVQHHNCDVGVTGKTISMTLRYRRPAPLLRPLAFTIERSTTEARIRSQARLYAGGRLLCEADIAAVAADRASLPEVSARRTTGGSG
jgi:acyl-coenzyme A thioesterase PaaI-like protein